jgi:hypothetical protein
MTGAVVLDWRTQRTLSGAVKRLWYQLSAWHRSSSRRRSWGGGRGLALEHDLQVAAVVADRRVARVASCERVAFGVGVGAPREVLADR